MTADTIIAVSSAVGGGTRQIVRVSGPLAGNFVRQLGGRCPVPGTAEHVFLAFADFSVPAWVYWFASPRSYTGEDVAEFHLPGSALLARMLLEELQREGARMAEPGEFTARAFFSGRIGLTEAEGVAATIAAGNDRELQAARQLLAGELAHRLQPCLDELVQTLALVEVGIDFSEEDVTFLEVDAIHLRLAALIDELDELLTGSSRFESLSHEPTVVFAGRPNAGKSTLLNALAGHDRAVVSSQAGTTRDVLSATVDLRRGRVRLLDVAGLEESTPSHSIEKQMRDKARQAITGADVRVLIQAADDAGPALLLPQPAHLCVQSKSDLLHSTTDDPARLSVSARTGSGMDRLKDRIDELAFGQEHAGVALTLNSRHVKAISDARAALSRCLELNTARAGAEVLAMELRESLDLLGQVLGQVTPDDVLGQIFGSFCIGK